MATVDNPTLPPLLKYVQAINPGADGKSYQIIPKPDSPYSAAQLVAELVVHFGLKKIETKPTPDRLSEGMRLEIVYDPLRLAPKIVDRLVFSLDQKITEPSPGRHSREEGNTR